MSTWTHVSGAIRYDLYAHTTNDEEDKDFEESTRYFLKSKAEDNLPAGSEGPLKVDVNVRLKIERDETFSMQQEASATVLVEGNLRDFSHVSFPLIEAWFKRMVTNDYWDSTISPRQGVIMMEEDGGNRQVKTVTFTESRRFNEVIEYV